MMITDSARDASQYLTKLGPKKLSQFIEKVGPIEIPQRYGEDPLMGLCQIIVSQQLSNQAARAIWNHICQVLPDRSDRMRTLAQDESEHLGLSRAKRRTLSILLKQDESWFESQIQSTPEERAFALTNLWGIGPWSIAMLELFVLKNPDVWSDGDLILRRISGLLADEANMDPAKWVSSAIPYRSFLALYCWKLKDS
jgi:3-methyladenine DNA glycosylase/8-oxoguanine DNA glycosylase